MNKLSKILISAIVVLGVAIPFIASALVLLPPTVQRGDLLVASNTIQIVRLATGTTAYVLQMLNGVPTWVPTSSLGITGGSGSSSIVFLANGYTFITTSTINFQAGTNVTITTSTNGTYTIAASGGSGVATTTINGFMSPTFNLLGTAGRISSTISNGSTTFDLANSGVSAGSCTNCNITVDAYGRVTVQGNGSSGGASSTTLYAGNMITLSPSPISTTGTIQVNTSTLHTFILGYGYSSSSPSTTIPTVYVVNNLGNWAGTWLNRTSSDFLASSTNLAPSTTIPTVYLINNLGNWAGTWLNRTSSDFLASTTVVNTPSTTIPTVYLANNLGNWAGTWLNRTSSDFLASTTVVNTPSTTIPTVYLASTASVHATATLSGEPYLSLSGQAFTAGKVSATTSIVGVLPLANGGTGTSTTPVKASFLVGDGSLYQLSTLPDCASGNYMTYNTTTRAWACTADTTGGGGGSVSTSSPITINQFPFWTSVGGGLSGTSTLTISGTTVNNSGTISVNGASVLTTATSYVSTVNGASGAITIANQATGTVNGVAFFDSANHVTSSLGFTWVPATGLFTASGTTVTNNLTVDGSTLFADAANDKVGIRTLKPSSTVHIIGTNAVTSTFQITDPSGNNTMQVWTTSTAKDNYFIVQNSIGIPVFGVTSSSIPAFYGTSTAALGGSLLAAAGNCASNVTLLPFLLSTSTYGIDAYPQTIPGNGNVKWDAYISRVGTTSTDATTEVCAIIAATPVSTKYNLFPKLLLPF